MHILFSFELESFPSDKIFNLLIPALNFHWLNPKLKPYNTTYFDTEFVNSKT
jgi:hypothetical protein